MINPNYRYNSFDPPIPFLTGDAATLHSIISEVDRVLSLPTNEVEERQAHYLYKLIEHFWKVSPQFRKRIPGGFVNSKSKTLGDLLNRFKPEPKSYFRETAQLDVEGAVPEHHLPVHLATTSGSTGTPLTVRATAVKRAISMAQVPWAHLASGTDFSWRRASVKPSNKVLCESPEWDSATSLLFKVGGMLSVPTSLDIYEQLSQLEKFAPDCLLIFPSVLKEYISIWSKGVIKPLKLAAIRTMGETLSDQTREDASLMTGARVLDTYSSSEIGRIATQCVPYGPYRVNTYSLAVEILNDKGDRCKPGEVGRVVITDLMNYATPLVRYDTGDYAIPYDLSHHNLQKIVGRQRNMILLPDGRKIWPLIGYQEISKVVPIRQFHVVQTETGKLKAKFQVSELPSDSQKQAVKAIICENLDYLFDIEDCYQLEPIERGKNGKLEDFVSLVQ